MNRPALVALREQATAMLRRAETCHAPVPMTKLRDLLDALLAPDAAAASCNCPEVPVWHLHVGGRVVTDPAPPWFGPSHPPPPSVDAATPPPPTASGIALSLPYVRAERDAYRAATRPAALWETT